MYTSGLRLPALTGEASHSNVAHWVPAPPMYQIPIRPSGRSSPFLQTSLWGPPPSTGRPARAPRVSAGEGAVLNRLGGWRGGSATRSPPARSRVARVISRRGVNPPPRRKGLPLALVFPRVCQPPRASGRNIPAANPIGDRAQG